MAVVPSGHLVTHKRENFFLYIYRYFCLERGRKGVGMGKPGDQNDQVPIFPETPCYDTKKAGHSQ